MAQGTTAQETFDDQDESVLAEPCAVPDPEDDPSAVHDQHVGDTDDESDEEAGDSLDVFLEEPPVGSPLLSHTLFGVYLGVILWAALWCRLPALRALIPFRKGV